MSVTFVPGINFRHQPCFLGAVDFRDFEGCSHEPLLKEGTFGFIAGTPGIIIIIIRACNTLIECARLNKLIV